MAFKSQHDGTGRGRKGAAVVIICGGGVGRYGMVRYGKGCGLDGQDGVM